MNKKTTVPGLNLSELRDLAAWYEGLLPEVMFCQEFIILGQKHIPSRSYRYGGPELRPVKA